MAQGFRDERLDNLQNAAVQSLRLSEEAPKQTTLMQSFNKNVDALCSAYYYIRNRTAIGFGVAALSLGAVYSIPDIKDRIDATISEANEKTQSPYAPTTSPRPPKRGS